MRRLFSLVASTALLAGAAVIVTGSPAHANANIEATSVALTSDSEEGVANCSNGADLDVGMVGTDTDTEAGITSTLGDDNIGGFEHPGNWNGFDGVFEGYGMPISEPQPEGSIIGSYAWITLGAPTASTAAEWFVLYRCSDTEGGNVVLSTCFGDYGTCPQTAEEAAAGLFGATVDDSTPDPGQVVTVSAEGCFYPLGGAVLLDGTTGLGGDSIAPNPDGTFQIELTIPAGTAPGTALTARVDCGYDGQTVLSTTLDLTVAAEATTTTTTEAAAVPVQPRFTG